MCLSPQRAGEEAVQGGLETTSDPAVLSGSVVVQTTFRHLLHERPSDGHGERHTTKQKHLLETRDVAGETARGQQWYRRTERHQQDAFRSWEGTIIKTGEGFRKKCHFSQRLKHK